MFLLLRRAVHVVFLSLYTGCAVVATPLNSRGMVVSRVEVTQEVLSIGFTGTRTGITAMQRERLMGWLSEHAVPRLPDVQGHYGDCIEADYEFFLLCKALGIYLICHPPLDRRFRAFTHADADEIRPMKGYLERDWDIAVESNLLIATPKEMGEPESHIGSGTWTTVGYARKLHRPIVKIFPDGRVD
jgi:hypothetical protein